MDNLSYFLSIFPKYLSDLIEGLDNSLKYQINEIRIRLYKPVIIYIKTSACFFKSDGTLTSSWSEDCVCISKEDFDLLCDRLCNNSYHTNMQTLVEGFVTVKNGSRVGVASTAVFKDDAIHSVRDITSLNIRISHSYKDCSKKIIDAVCKSELPSIIVAGKPNSGKTTFLRDYVRLISNGYLNEYIKVSVIDERKEIASFFDVGINTDVLSGFEKSKGIEIAVRTLSPDLIVCDEIGNTDELISVKKGFLNGVKFAVSVHLGNEDEIFRNSIINPLISTGQFDYLIILQSYTDKFKIINLTEKLNENNGNCNDNNFHIIDWCNSSSE